MTIVRQSRSATGGQEGGSTISVAWVSNEEANYRLAFVAFEYRTIDDPLGTYARLKGLGPPGPPD